MRSTKQLHHIHHCPSHQLHTTFCLGDHQHHPWQGVYRVGAGGSLSKTGGVTRAGGVDKSLADSSR